MKKRTLIAVYFVSVTVAVILSLLLSGFLLENLTGPEFPYEIPPEYLPTLSVMITLKTAISFVNMTLILLMLAIYVGLYRKIRSNFTAGLVLLLSVLLMNALTSNPLLFLRFGFPVVGPGIGFIIPDLFSTIALTILFYLSLE